MFWFFFDLRRVTFLHNHSFPFPNTAVLCLDLKFSIYPAGLLILHSNSQVHFLASLPCSLPQEAELYKRHHLSSIIWQRNDKAL